MAATQHGQASVDVRNHAEMVPNADQEDVQIHCRSSVEEIVRQVGLHLKPRFASCVRVPFMADILPGQSLAHVPKNVQGELNKGREIVRIQFLNMVERVALIWVKQLKCVCATFTIVQWMEVILSGQNLQTVLRHVETAQRLVVGAVQIHYLSMVEETVQNLVRILRR